MVRIKYNKTDEGLCTPPILIKDTFYQATIAPGFIVTIINNKSEDIVTLKGKNLRSCQRIVKLQLKRLGANFLDEVRRRK